jgi:hypothetical protein
MPRHTWAVLAASVVPSGCGTSMVALIEEFFRRRLGGR